ncbi:hypothetical protein KEN49_CDS0063 [Pseudomonas phage vB_Pae3705-KEN49]
MKQFFQLLLSLLFKLPVLSYFAEKKRLEKEKKEEEKRQQEQRQKELLDEQRRELEDHYRKTAYDRLAKLIHTRWYDEFNAYEKKLVDLAVSSGKAVSVKYGKVTKMQHPHQFKLLNDWLDDIPVEDYSK